MNQDNELILVTMDVTSLYTNIPNHEGIVSVIKMLEPTYNRRNVERCETLDKTTSSKLIIDQSKAIRTLL